MTKLQLIAICENLQGVIVAVLVGDTKNRPGASVEEMFMQNKRSCGVEDSTSCELMNIIPSGTL